MTLFTEKGTFTKVNNTTANASQEVNLTGAFQPKILILWCSTQTTSDGTYADDTAVSFGFSDGTNDACQAYSMDEDLETEAYIFRNDSIISIFNPASSNNEVNKATVASFDSDGFTLTWTTNTVATQWVIHYIAIGGTDITNVSVVSTTVGNVSTGNHSFNGSGTSFTPDFALTMTAADTYPTINSRQSANDNSLFSIGAVKSTSEQFVVWGRDETIGTSDCDMYINDAACLSCANNSTGAVTYLANFVSFDNAAGGGITVNVTSIPNASTNMLAFLFVKGGKWDTGVFTQRSGTGTQNVTIDTGLDPALVFLTGINSATEGSVQTSEYVCMGASDGTREGNCYWGNTNNLGTFVTSRSTDTGKVYRQATPAATATSSTTNAQCDMTGMSSTGQFTLDWTTADTTLRQMAFWVVGEISTGTNFNRSPATESITVADSSVTRVLSASRLPSSDSTIVADSSLTRIVSASRLAQTGMYDDFEAGTYSFTEGGNSPNGKWTNAYLGGTGSSSGVRFSSSVNSNVMWQKPQVSTSAGETHASRNESTTDWANFDCTFKMRTIAQQRTGSSPNAWETAWIIFRYTDDAHHYYFTIKTASAGCEFGRKDYSPAVEQQMFLATPGSPSATVGQWYKVRIRAIRNHFWIWVDDSLVIDLVDDGSVGFDSQTSGLPPPPTAAMYSGSFNPYNEDAEVEFDEIAIGEQDFVTVADVSVTGAKVKSGVPSTESITVADSSLTRLLSAVRVPTTEVVTPTDSSLTRILSAIRVPSSDTVTATDSSTTRSATRVRLPSTDTVTPSDSSLTRRLSASRAPTPETLTPSESSLTRMLQAFRSPSADTITTNENLSGGKVYGRIPNTETVTVADSSLTRILSAVRLPSSDSINVLDSSITRMLSLLRIPSQDSITTSENLTSQYSQGAQTINRAPTAENITVADSSLTRLLSALRLPSTDTISTGELLTRILSAIRSPTSDTVVTADNASRIRSLLRTTAADSITVLDSSVTRMLSALRLPSQDTITVTAGTATRMLSAIRLPSVEVISISESLGSTVSGRISRSVSDTVNVVESSLNRMLQAFRVPSADTTNINEQLTRSRTAVRLTTADTSVVSEVALTRVVSLTRSVSSDTTAIIESALNRILSAKRNLQDTVTIAELQSLIQHSRVLQDTVLITEPTLNRVVTAIRTVAPEFVDIAESVFFQTFHKFVFDSVTVAESLFKERTQLTGSVTYATPDEVRPLLGNIGPTQRTDDQINLAIDAAYDEINTKTNRIPPNEWKDTDHNFGIIKKLARYIAAREMAVGIKDFDTDALQTEIDRLWEILTYDTTSSATQNIVISSEPETYATSAAGIIWSSRYKNLKKNPNPGDEGSLNIPVD